MNSVGSLLLSGLNFFCTSESLILDNTAGLFTSLFGFLVGLGEASRGVSDLTLTSVGVYSLSGSILGESGVLGR
jgi:hypothetical protein